MSRRATELGPARTLRRRGSAFVGAIVVLVGLSGLVLATVTSTAVDIGQSRRAIDEVRAEFLAQSAMERGVQFLQDAVEKNVFDPLGGLRGLFALDEQISPYVGEPIMNGGIRVGAFSVTMRPVQETPTSITIQLDVTGYLPAAPQDLGPRERLIAWSSLRTTVQFGIGPSNVFDYAYFINNWGWFYGNSIVCNGNARSNGQFDAAGYRPTVTGQPIYESLTWNGTTTDLVGYHDDNEDGAADGGDGGVFSGWDVVGAHNVRGIGGAPSNQHDFEDRIEMPNLTDLSPYEEGAILEGSRITIGGVTMTDAVFGDDAGESGNLYLHGTPSDPVVLQGPVVVRGDVVLSGTVTGQGAIYAGGNVYVPDSITYANPPSTRRPADNQEATTEQWIADNWNKDFLGLFARENVVVGDHTHNTWQHYVGNWMRSSMNGSAEDAGEDGIPNTLAGRDGVLGTSDDDVLEGDGVFTTETYSAEDAALGLIPDGFTVGDPIPGTGEDIDGDGQFDATASLNDVRLTTPLTQAHWGGNMPVSGFSSYRDIATLYASNLDAVFYTNHSFCYVVLGGSTARINGAMISRNENIVYGTPALEFNYDARLLGRSSGMAGNLLPRVVYPMVVQSWIPLDTDPNRYVPVP